MGREQPEMRRRCQHQQPAVSLPPLGDVATRRTLRLAKSIAGAVDAPHQAQGRAFPRVSPTTSFNQYKVRPRYWRPGRRHWERRASQDLQPPPVAQIGSEQVIVSGHAASRRGCCERQDC